MPRSRLEDERSRSRSRSPYPTDEPTPHRRRSYSPSRKHRHRHHHHAHRRSKPSNLEPDVLPFKALKLSKHGLATHRPLLMSYLDIQKQINIQDLLETEVKGRWKSFMGKWNRGELAEGWYDPETIRKALASSEGTLSASPRTTQGSSHRPETIEKNEDSSEDDEYGPRAPRPQNRGPAVPGFADLELRDELSTTAAHDSRLADRQARTLDRKAQLAALDELAPRAEAGTRERQLEKRREAAASNKAHAEARDEAIGEVRDAELLGAGGEDDFRARRKELQRKKNEREIRREEILRARAAEREERLRGLMEKEEETVALLKAIAKERFGGGAGGGLGKGEL